MLHSEVIVSAVKRDTSIRTKDVRSSGFIPGVIYGQGENAVSIQIEYQSFRKAFRLTGTAVLLDVELDGEKIPTLVHDVQYHPVSGEYFHLDLYEVHEGVPVTTHVEVVIEGLSSAVKNKSAVLVAPVKTLEIRCLPRKLFHDVRIDVSCLKEYHDTIKVSDLPLIHNKDVEILTPLDTVLATTNPPKGGIKALETPVLEQGKKGVKGKK